MSGDVRATQFARYLNARKYSPDALRRIAYALQQLESKGDLEIFISDEVDGDYEEGREPVQ